MASILKVDQIQSADGTTEYLNAGSIKNASLHSSVTGGSGITALGTVASGTLGSSVTFPAGHVLQVKHVVMRGYFNTVDSSNHVLVTDGVDPLQIQISVSNATNKILIFSNINGHAHNRQGGALKVIRTAATSLSNADAIANELSYHNDSNKPASISTTNIGDIWTMDGSGDDTWLANASSILEDVPGVGIHTYGVFAATISNSQGGTVVNASANGSEVNSSDYLRAISTFMIMEVQGA